MKKAHLHLNLLKDQEKLSSSPVRLRILFPILALTFFAAVLLWWGSIAGRLFIVRNELSTLNSDLTARKREHADILKQRGELKNYETELEQIGYYLNARAVYGELLAKVALAVPARVQLTYLAIPEPKEQTFPPAPVPQKGKPVVKPLPNPIEKSERVSLRIRGMAQKIPHVTTFTEAMEEDDFKGMIIIDGDSKSPTHSPIQHAFHDEIIATMRNRTMIVFDFEYLCPERRFQSK